MFAAVPCCPVSQEPYEPQGPNRPRTLPCGHSISHASLETVRAPPNRCFYGNSPVYLHPHVRRSQETPPDYTCATCFSILYGGLAGVEKLPSASSYLPDFYRSTTPHPCVVVRGVAWPLLLSPCNTPGARWASSWQHKTQQWRLDSDGMPPPRA